MSQTVNTGLTQAEVVINGNALPLPYSPQRLIEASANCDTTYDTLYTVPASKVFYLFGFSIYTNSAKVFYIGLNSSDKYIVASTTSALTVGISSGACPLLKATEGQVIAGKTSSGGDVFKIWGVEVDA